MLEDKRVSPPLKNSASPLREKQSLEFEVFMAAVMTERADVFLRGFAVFEAPHSVVIATGRPVGEFG